MATCTHPDQIQVESPEQVAGCEASSYGDEVAFVLTADERGGPA